MNHEHRIIQVKKVNDLKIATRARLAPNQALFVIHFQRIRLADVVNDEFRFFGLDVVLSNLVAIPLNPAELVRHTQPFFENIKYISKSSVGLDREA